MNRQGTLFIISAPSGAGKTTILKEVKLRLPDIRFSVSCTTRPPRSGEEHGKDYFFMSHEEFLKGISENRFVEWACVHGNYYGTDRRTIEGWINEGSDVLLDIDVQGGRLIKCQYPGAATIFILPPSWEELERRLRQRGTDSEEVIQKRLHNARGEIAEALWYEYTVINDDLSKAVEEVMAIIKSYRCRTKNRFDFLRGLLNVDFRSACSGRTAET